MLNICSTTCPLLAEEEEGADEAARARRHDWRAASVAEQEQSRASRPVTFFCYAWADEYDEVRIMFVGLRMCSLPCVRALGRYHTYWRPRRVPLLLMLRQLGARCCVRARTVP